MKIKPSNSTPPPIPYQDEANDNGIFEGTGSGQDSVEVEDKFARRICLFRDKCECRTSQLLVCTENGCPIAIHEVCMITEPAFDDTGKFYCPYCWYKRQVERTDELRLLAERDLSIYNLFKRDGGNDMKAANLSTMEGKNDSGDCENGLNHEQTICVKSVVEEKSISIAHGPDNVAGEQLMQEEDIENTSGSENDGNGDDTLGTSMALITKDATSNVPAIESFEFVSPDLDTMTLIERKKYSKHIAKTARPLRVYSPMNHSFQPSTSRKERKIDQQGEATTATSSVQCQEVTKRIINPTLICGKRRRLNWTTEEEDTLKEGVRRFSLTINKNIPWRKILEFGHNVFDNNRVPADLKDKWKKIMAKDDPKCDKGTLVRFEE